MSKLPATFDRLKQNQQVGLITFITCGDPDPSLTVTIMHELVASGADVIELGMPFSDPMADGPVIEKASERAIAKGVDLHEAIRCVKVFRETNTSTPVVLMGYLNPVLQFGRDAFLDAAGKAGVDGLLIVDCPIEESSDLHHALAIRQMQQIYLVAPTSSPERRARMAEAATGFLYYVSFAGITGGAQLDPVSVNAAVKSLKSISRAPVAVGFGIKDADSAKALAESADAVVIGSALVQQLAGALSIDAAKHKVREFLQPITAALRTVKRS
jgi:tryptophan synthase alpha chain